MKKLFAEFFGTFWLVFGGCGSALYAAGIPDLGIGFGFTVLTISILFCSEFKLSANNSLPLQISNFLPPKSKSGFGAGSSSMAGSCVGFLNPPPS